jgi:hypothetical protein
MKKLVAGGLLSGLLALAVLLAPLTAVAEAGADALANVAPATAHIQLAGSDKGVIDAG